MPCDAWKHNSDGTWVEVGTIVVGGNATSGMTFKDTDEAKMLDAKCRTSAADEDIAFQR